ncbi:MAG TPA: spermidine/putrescine ABC transporter substrate-binding protein [Streptosporangiaceae bacterium]
MNGPDPVWLRGLTRPRSRRAVLRTAGLSAAGLALAACGIPGQGHQAASEAEMARFWRKQKRHGHVRFANWPLYIDVGAKKNDHPTLDAFTKETGITVSYDEVIQDDADWFGKVRPQLAAGSDIGYDLQVITNGIQMAQFIALGFLVPLDHSRMPNYRRNIGSAYRDPAYDKGARFTAPWASGMTGIAYNPKYVTKPPTRIADLWNPAYKGKIGMMSDVQELGNFGMLLDGVAPEKSTEKDWRKAADVLKKQRDSGIVRKYYGNDYIKPLTNGDIWITMAWSGDIFQQNVSEGTDLRFLIPQEGGNLWTDNMTIPKTAQNPLDALMLIDYYYRPLPAARLAEYVNYVSPVPAAKAVIEQDIAKASGADKKTLQQVAGSPLVFPGDAEYAKLHNYRTLNKTELTTYQSVFQPIVAG